MFKKYKWDIIIITILLLIGSASFIIINSIKTSSDSLIAKITDSNSEITEINLSKEKEEEREITVTGLYDDLIVGVKYNAIRVIYSSCPHQDCVKQGSVSTTNTPIVCLYNKVYIVLFDNTDNEDIVI
jgi:Uncharacterized protein conserved in bacteria